MTAAFKKLRHDEAVREVYRLTPQIREYDEFMYLGVRWLPYTMFFHHKDYRSDVINTDDLGFRFSEYKGERYSTGCLSGAEPVNLVVGGSTVLGTGATADRHTISSRLSEATGEVWLNFSGRGYNSVQEVILFLMHQSKFQNIGKVVIFSGLNTLSLEGLPDHLASDHGRYYYSYEFSHYMNRYNDDLKRRKNTYSSELESRSMGFIKTLEHKLKRFTEPETNPADVVFYDDTDLGQRISRAAGVITNSLSQWKQLLSIFHAKLVFVLQPMSFWTKHSFTLEEREIFHAIDSCPNNFWRMFRNILDVSVHEPFSREIREKCLAIGVDYRDMNKILSVNEQIEDYLFVDHVHFNDKGYNLIAELLAKEIM